MQREELAAWLRLTETPGIGNVSARKLLGAFGLPEQVWQQPQSALRQVLSAAQAQAAAQAPDHLDALLERTWDWLQAGGDDGLRRRIIALGDADYPQALLHVDEAPLLLYLLGNAHLGSVTADGVGLRIRPEASLAIVGSRNPTPQGAINAHAFAKAMVQAGLSVVSGLALGIDGAAHAGALDGWNPQSQHAATLAVVGTGLDRVYPRAHRALAHRIAECGLLLSEYPLGTAPLTANFPKRNRLITALSQGTLVVEAALQSGSLISARLASEQGKEVFAIPGSIHAAQSRGCHALIKQGAKLVESAQDILEELRIAPACSLPAGSGGDAARGLPDAGDDGGLLAALGHDPVSLEALQARTGQDTASLQAALMALELDGVLARLPGGLFQRLVR